MSEAASVRADVEQGIREAFRGVTLGGGTSLRQAQVIDNYGEGVTDEEFDRLPLSEITQSWELVPWDELESDNVAHLDPEGWRYYIPAFMLSVLEKYEGASMRVIGTLSSLYPKDDVAAYYAPRYNLLTFEQKRAIARFLEALPSLVQLGYEDSKVVERALKKYWRPYLPLIKVGGHHDD
jgi:hypothetical protein